MCSQVINSRRYSRVSVFSGPSCGKGEQVLQSQPGPSGGGTILPQLAHDGNLATAPHNNAVHFPNIAGQRYKYFDAAMLWFDVKYGQRIAAEIKLVKYTSGNDRRTARMPMAPMDSQPEFAVDPCQENGSAMLVEPVILERSYKRVVMWFPAFVRSRPMGIHLATSRFTSKARANNCSSGAIAPITR